MASVDFSQIGVSGLRQAGGWIFDEWMPELQGQRGRRALRQMSDNDPVVGGLMFAVKSLIRQVGWFVAPGDGAPQEDPRVDYVEECRVDMAETWEDTLSEIMSFLLWGFDVHEIVYKQRSGSDISKYHDGRIGWHSWQMRGQESIQRWEFDPLGAVAGVHQLGAPDYQPHFIPAEKFLLFRTSTDRGNPEGRSILRNAYVPWYYKTRIQKIEAIGIERDLAGLPIAGVPREILDADATADDAAIRDAIFNIVTNIRRDDQEGIVMPLEYDEHGNKTFTLELLSTGGERQFDTSKIIQRYDTYIAMTVLADFLMLGHEGVGSHALSQDKTDLFVVALTAWLDAICAVVNTAITRLLRLNGMSTDNPPELQHGDVERPNLALLGSFLQSLGAAGFEMDTTFHGELLERLLEIAGLPKQPETIPPQLHENALTSNQPTESAPQPTTGGNGNEGSNSQPGDKGQPGQTAG